jgi:hypothetical protein
MPEAKFAESAEPEGPVSIRYFYQVHRDHDVYKGGVYSGPYRWGVDIIRTAHLYLTQRELRGHTPPGQGPPGQFRGRA